MCHRSPPRSAMQRGRYSRALRRARGTLFALAVLWAAGPAAAMQRVYLANISGGTVAVVDADRRAVIGSIPVGRQPDGIAASPDGRTVYVANFADATVSVIDTASDAVVATIDVDLGPVGIAVDPAGNEVYVACKVARTLVVIDAASRTVAASIGVGQGPNDVVVAPDGSRVYVSRSEGDSVAVFDPATRQQTDLLRVGPTPNRLALSPDGEQLYVTLYRNSQLVRITLAGAAPLMQYANGHPTDVAVSADGTSVYVSGESGAIGRFDAATLEPLDGTCGGVRPYGVLPMPGGAVLVADMGGDAFRVLGAGAPSETTVDGGPFALAALPRETPALDVAIESPASGARLDSGDVPVTLTAGPGTQPLRAWTLRLRALGDAPAEQVIATGTEPVASALVATIGADLIHPGTHYRLIATGTAADETQVTRTTLLSVPDRQYALVPLEPTRGDPYEGGAVMDGAGRLFARFDAAQQSVALFDAETGQESSVTPPLLLTTGTALQLSRNGNRLLLSGRIGDIFTFGLLDLASRLFTALPNYVIAFDLDADGHHVATLNYRGQGWNYDLFDIEDGSVTAITDLPTLEDIPPTCRPFAVGRPRLSADASTAAFFTILPLGGPPGCNLYAYDVASQTRRFVRGFGETGPASTPSMDDAGTRVAALLPPDPISDGPTSLALVDLRDGSNTPLLTDSTSAVLDGVLSGDGTSVVLSSCDDLDPSVGNPDFSEELFRLDLASGHVTQITDTRGGPQDCFVRDGEPLSPQVSRDCRRRRLPRSGLRPTVLRQLRTAARCAHRPRLRPGSRGARRRGQRVAGARRSRRGHGAVPHRRRRFRARHRS